MKAEYRKSTGVDAGTQDTEGDALCMPYLCVFYNCLWHLVLSAGGHTVDGLHQLEKSVQCSRDCCAVRQGRLQTNGLQLCCASSQMARTLGTASLRQAPPQVEAAGNIKERSVSGELTEGHHSD